MRAADRKPFVGKTRRVFRQSQTAREGGLFLRESPSHGFAVPAPFRQGDQGGRGLRIATASVRTDLAMTGFPWSVVHGRRATARVAPTGGVLMVPYAAGHMGPALQGVFVGQGPRALPGVRYKVSGWGL